jgi:adenylylsulfate kinase
MENQNIFPFLDKLIARQEKEALLGQHVKVIWLTGLSGAGKSTIALGLEKLLHDAGYLSIVLDGDNIRNGINSDLKFSLEDRVENIRRISEISKLFLNCGVIAINAFVSPTLEIRKITRDIVGKENLLEIFVDTPIEVCEQRDVKGLYQKARAGILKNFTGIDSPFEIPVFSDYVVKTENRKPEESIMEVYQFVLTKINKMT